MFHISQKSNAQKRLSILICLIIIFFKKVSIPATRYNLKSEHFYEIFKKDYIKNNTILIFEPNTYHHECIPGYSKYFIDLGYNVDILLHFSGVDSLTLFEERKKIRLLTFNKLNEIELNAKNLSSIIKKYDYVLLQSTERTRYTLYNSLDILNMNNSIFVFHNINYMDNNFSNYLTQNRIWTLGKFPKFLQVNPHYFGNIKLKDKNNKTRFFVTSSHGRNYTDLVKYSEKLINENYNFEIIITGRSKYFNSDSLPKNLKNIFKFRYNVGYLELYLAIDSSDFIVIPLNDNSKYDNSFKTIKVSGSIQMVYGFLKPAIINQEFAQFYNLDKKNKII